MRPSPPPALSLILTRSPTVRRVGAVVARIAANRAAAKMGGWNPHSRRPRTRRRDPAGRPAAGDPRRRPRPGEPARRHRADRRSPAARRAGEPALVEPDTRGPRPSSGAAGELAGARPPAGEVALRAVAEGHGALAAGAAGPDRPAARLLPGLPRRRRSRPPSTRPPPSSRPARRTPSRSASRPVSAPTGVRSAPATRPSRGGATCGSAT